MAAESVNFVDVLQSYRAIDPGLPVGRIPVAQCLEIQTEAEAQELGPGAQLDYAWLRLETSMAMVTEVKGQKKRDQTYAPKEINISKDRTRTDFRIIAQDEQAPRDLRVRADFALASLGVYYEMAEQVPRYSDVNRRTNLHYLRSIQRIAEGLLTAPERTPEDEALLRDVASVAILTEHAGKSGWYSLASSRQPWSINALNRFTGRRERMIVADASPSDDIMAIPPDALGDDLWDEEAGPHATLAQYIRMEPGFTQNRAHYEIRKKFTNIADRHVFHMLAYDEAHAEPKTRTPEDPTESAAVPESSEMPKPVEVGWYLRQPAQGFHEMDLQALRTNMINLEDAHREEAIHPAYQHILGWMQLDYARSITIEVRKKRDEVARLRKEEMRASRANAPALAAQAERIAEAADTLFVQAKERFDTAADTLSAAAEAMSETQIGESMGVRLDAAAAPVYKALFTESDPAELAKVVDTYVRRIASLYLPMRDAERVLRQRRLEVNLYQIDAILAFASKTSLCLLIANSSDEAARDLALPARPRTGGRLKEMEAVVFPIDYLNDAYDTESPVNIQIKPDSDKVTHEKGYVAVGWDLLMLKNDPLRLLAKLASAAPSKKAGGKKRARDESIDTIGYLVTNAISDAVSG